MSHDRRDPAYSTVSPRKLPFALADALGVSLDDECPHPPIAPATDETPADLVSPLAWGIFIEKCVAYPDSQTEFATTLGTSIDSKLDVFEAFTLSVASVP